MGKKNSSSLTEKFIKWRIWIQTGFLLVWLDPFAFRLHNFCGPVFHCYSCPLSTFACPIGIIAQFSTIGAIPFLAIGTVLLAGAVFGTFVCGWACPFGFLQDMAGKVPTKKIKLPHYASHFRYVVLIVTVIAVPYFFGKDNPLFICRICPAGALEGALPFAFSQIGEGKIIWPSALKITVLALFLVAIFVKHRPWCTLFCPLGAIFGLFNKTSIFYMHLDKDKCNSCKSCRQVCRQHLKPDDRLDHSTCIRCMECASCHKDAVKVGSVFTPAKETKENS